MAHNNLGVILMRGGRLEQAEKQYLLELRVNPGYDNALYNLGLIYAAQGRFSEAAALWERTLAVNPEHPDAREKLRSLRTSAGTTR
jgi:Flp pilus assembly protein TadD